MQSSVEVPVNLLAPSLDLIVLTLAAFAIVTIGVVWLVRRAWRGPRLQAGHVPQVTQRLEQLETDLRALEDSTDYLADALRVPPPAGRTLPATPRPSGDAR